MKLLTVTLETQRKVQCGGFISDCVCLCVYVNLGIARRRIYVVRVVFVLSLNRVFKCCAAFIEVIHASIIEGKGNKLLRGFYSQIIQ